MDLSFIPQLPQRQDSLAEQLDDLRAIANRLGLYDAADALLAIYGKMDILRYGCHCDLEPHMQPDDCVIEESGYCIYAKPGMRKEQCKYWRIITSSTIELTGASSAVE